MCWSRRRGSELGTWWGRCRCRRSIWVVVLVWSGATEMGASGETDPHARTAVIFFDLHRTDVDEEFHSDLAAVARAEVGWGVAFH